VHFEDCMVDPVIGTLSGLFDVGSRISRGRTDANEEQLLEMIGESELLWYTHFRPDTVGIGGIFTAAFCFPRVFLCPTDITVTKRDQPRRAESWQLTQPSQRFANDLFAVRPDIHYFVALGIDDVEMFRHVFHESLRPRRS